jgi:hypothetical protein
LGLGPDHVGGLAGRDHGRPRARFPCGVMRLTSLEPRANRGLALRDGTGVSGLDGADYLFFGRVAGENLGNPAQNLKAGANRLAAPTEVRVRWATGRPRRHTPTGSQ